MRIYRLLIALASFAIVVSSCKKEQTEEAPSLAVSSTTVTIPSTGSSESLDIASNTSWNITNPEGWLTVSPMSGKGDGKISFSAEENVGGAGSAAAERTAKVVVSVKGKDIEITVTQSGEETVFTVTGGTAEVPETGGTVNVKVDYNTSYSVNIPANAKDWIEQVQTKSVATDNLVFNIAANPGAAREAKIEFKPASGYAAYVTVKQAATQVPIDDKSVKIGTADEFLAFASSLKDYAADVTVKLTADIDLSSKDYTPADTLFAVFDGDGHTVKYSHIIMEKSSNACIGLFSEVKGTVKNVKVNAIIGGDPVSNPTYTAAFIGGVAANLYDGALISDCETTVDINVHCGSTAGKIGGVVGRALGGSIKNCTVNGTVTSNNGSTTADQLGGIAGQVRGNTEILNCTNNASISYEGGSNPRAGGMAGYLVDVDNVVISGCTNTGFISFTPKSVKTQYGYIGGMTGYIADSFVNETSNVLIEACRNSGEFYSSTAASSNDYQLRYGGMACYLPKISSGKASVVRISNCSYTGKATVEVNGTVGAGSNIQIGGIFGFAEASGYADIDKCTVGGSLEVKGLASIMSGIYAGGGTEATKISGCTITKEARFTMESGTSFGLLASTPAALTNKITAKVGACTVTQAGSPITMSASNYVSYLFGNENIKDASGVTFGE